MTFRVVEVSGCGVNGDTDLSNCTTCSGNWWEVGDEEPSCIIDFVSPAVIALACENNFKFIPRVEDEAILDCCGWCCS